jgi:uncharacterized protein (DUF1697 family)
MTKFVALLRAVNVGGTGKLAMTDLAQICRDLGHGGVRTYIQSGNVVFTSAKTEAAVRADLEAALTAKMGKPIEVMVRTAAEMRAVLSANPFPDAPPNRVIVGFRNGPTTPDMLEGVVAPDGEEVRLGPREVYIRYSEGMGNSKLKLPKATNPMTARNINTVAKLADLAEALA